MNLFHYCSNAAMVSILASREIWISELALSNDQMEGKWIREVFRDYCRERDVSASDQFELLHHLDFVVEMAGYAGFCMSEMPDLLSQWRAYADNGAGVSIGFDRQYLETLGDLKRDRNDPNSAHLTKVVYGLDEQKRLFAEHGDEILKLVADGALRQPTFLDADQDNEKRRKQSGELRFRFVFFYSFVYEMKNPAFAEEREWRVVSHIVRTTPDATLSQLAKMEFKPSEDRIIPFARIPLEPLSRPSITEIVLGPRNATPERTVEAILLKYGWSNVTVRKSTASYR